MDDLLKLEDSKLNSNIEEILSGLQKTLTNKKWPFQNVPEIELKFGPYEIAEDQYAKVSVKLTRCEAGVDE